jgi:Tol biopolymer transport system component
MKKSVFLLVMILGISIVAVACDSPSAKVPIETASSSEKMTVPSESDAATVSPAPTEPAAIDLLSLGMSYSAADYGIYSISSDYFYWSPKAEYLVFLGYLKDSQSKYTPNIYLLHLKDNKITKIMDGVYDRNFYLTEPRWSEDESLLTIPFYDLAEKTYPVRLFNTNQEKLQVLPIYGLDASISPDMSKIAFSDIDHRIVIYNLSDKTSTEMPAGVKGYSPIWFSDNTRILFSKLTGRNPSNLEGAELQDICILDTDKSEVIKSLGKDNVYKSHKWLIIDKMAWVESGWDDGHYLNLLDLDSSKLTEFGEGDGISYQINNRELNFFVLSNGKGFTLFDRNLKELGVFPVMNNDQQWSNTALGLLSDGRLLYWATSQYQKHNAIILSTLNQQKITQTFAVEGLYYAKASTDGSKIALVNDQGFNLTIFDSTAFK